MYELVFHKGITPEKWNAYPSHAQILMIANELNRSLNSLKKEDKENAVHSWERAFELTDLTMADSKNRRLIRELLRFREKLAECFISFDREELDLLGQELVRLNPEAYNALH